jgi:hypothetical protein
VEGDPCFRALILFRLGTDKMVPPSRKKDHSPLEVGLVEITFENVYENTGV